MDILGWIYWIIILGAVFGQFVIGVLLFGALINACFTQSSRALPKQ